MRTVLSVNLFFRYTLSLLTIVLLGVSVASCERRPLEEPGYRTALIPVSILWEDAGLDPDNDPAHDVYSASVWLFAKDGSPLFGDKPYREYRLVNPSEGEIEVPVGEYSVLIFNNTVSDFSSNVAFRGTDSYETFEYYAFPNTRSSYMRSEGKSLILEPDILAAWHLDTFEVTSGMITRTRTRGNDLRADDPVRSLLDVRPQLLTPRVHVIAHVHNLAAAASASAALLGMGSSVLLATGRTQAPASTYVFSMNNRQLEEPDLMHGTVEAQFNSFGPLQTSDNPQYGLEISFSLHQSYKGSVTFPTPPAPPFTFDVTGQVYSVEAELHIDLEIGIEVGHEIDLPLPVNGGGTGGKGGFGIGVSDWGDPINIPIN